MTIGIVIPGGVDVSGGDRVVPCIVWLVERLARRHTVHVITLFQEHEPATWTAWGAHVHNIGCAAGWRRRLLATIAAIHRQSPLDVLHAFWASSGLYAAIAGRRIGVPVVTHCAGGEFVGVREAQYGSQLTLRSRASVSVALAASTRVTVATEYMAQLAQKQGVDAAVIPLGVATDQWAPALPRARDTARPANLLHIGDLRPIKDQATLLRAVARLHADGAACELAVVGLDHMDGRLQRCAAELGISEHVTWHGKLDRARLRAVVDASDLLLISSRHEAGPIVFLEAAVAGVPTVGTAVGHIADWAPEGAVAVPTGDAAALAREVAALLSDDSRRLAIAHEAQRRAVRCDADDTAARFEALYCELADA